MRYLIAFVIPIFILSSAPTVLAQDMEASGINIGLKAGLNMAKLVGNDAKSPNGENWKFKPGFIGGVFINYTIADMFAVQPELLFSMKGAKYTETVLGSDIKYKLNLNYLDIPVLLKVMPARNSSLKPEFYAGPEVGFLLSAKSKVDGGPLGDTSEDIKDSLKTVDFGAVFGAGISYMVGPVLLGLDARYDLGLTKIDDTAAKADMKNSGFSIFLDYTFNFGPKSSY